MSEGSLYAPGTATHDSDTERPEVFEQVVPEGSAVGRINDQPEPEKESLLEALGRMFGPKDKRPAMVQLSTTDDFRVDDEGNNGVLLDVIRNLLTGAMVTIDKPSAFVKASRITVPYQGLPGLVIGEMPNRKSVVIVNRDAANPVYLGDSPYGELEDYGYKLAAGEAITLTSKAALYAKAEVGDVTLHVLGEYYA